MTPYFSNGTFVAISASSVSFVDGAVFVEDGEVAVVVVGLVGKFEVAGTSVIVLNLSLVVVNIVRVVNGAGEVTSKS